MNAARGLTEIARGHAADISDATYAALEQAYHLGLEHRALEPTEKELEALLNVLHYAREIKAQAAIDWEERHLESAVDRYDVAACKTPTGMRAHGSFIERGAKNESICSFCKVAIDHEPAEKRSTDR